MTQKEFYRTKEWKVLQRAFLASRMYICERCGGPATIAHHRIHITPGNINNTEITLNPDNLEALCQICHNQEHYSSGGPTAPGLHFNENGEIVKNEVIQKSFGD